MRYLLLPQPSLLSRSRSPRRSLLSPQPAFALSRLASLTSSRLNMPKPPSCAPYSLRGVDATLEAEDDIALRFEASSAAVLARSAATRCCASVCGSFVVVLAVGAVAAEEGLGRGGTLGGGGSGSPLLLLSPKSLSTTGSRSSSRCRLPRSLLGVRVGSM